MKNFAVGFFSLISVVLFGGTLLGIGLNLIPIVPGVITLVGLIAVVAMLPRIID